jgi:hypothetical protein
MAPTLFSELIIHIYNIDDIRKILYIAKSIAAKKLYRLTSLNFIRYLTRYLK